MADDIETNGVLSSKFEKEVNRKITHSRLIWTAHEQKFHQTNAY